MICEKCQKAIADNEPRVDVKEVSETIVRRYHATCAAAVMATQATAAPSAPDDATG